MAAASLLISTASNWIRLQKNSEESKFQLIFLQDNASSHVVKSTRKELLDLGWITVPHLPHSSDLVPTDYHLYYSDSNHLREKKFDNESDLETDLLNFFDEVSRLRTRDPLSTRVLATSHT